PYATLRRPLEHRQRGIFVAESEKVVRRLLESNLAVVSVLLPQKWLDDYRPLLEARTETFTVYLADKKTLEKLVGFTMFQGVLAVGKIPPPVPLEDILPKSPKPILFVAVDEIANAENLGSLVRNCVAFGAHALLVGETSSSPFLRRAVRNSMGAIFQLPVVELTNLAQTLRNLREKKIRCIAAHPHANGKMLSQMDFSGDCCIIFGSEGHGISKAVLENCNDAVAIPMSPTVDSLNVGAAAAVFLYEANRQRNKT
ncbi:MAG: TrmH family RNA methyltransferase, partial [Limisphaerales bacterium]